MHDQQGESAKDRETEEAGGGELNELGVYARAGASPADCFSCDNGARRGSAPSQ